MDRYIITWTPTNWVTVFLMAAGGFFFLQLAMKGYAKLKQARETQSVGA